MTLIDPSDLPDDDLTDSSPATLAPAGNPDPVTVWLRAIGRIGRELIAARAGEADLADRLDAIVAGGGGVASVEGRTGTVTLGDVYAALVHVHTTGSVTGLDATLSALTSAVAGKLDASAVDTDVTLAANSDTRVPAQKAVRTYIAARIADLVASSPAALDTLAELAAALGNDPNFATTIATQLGGKAARSANLSDLTNPATARDNLGVKIGTDVQAYDSELAALAALVSAADRLPYFTGPGTAGLATFTAAGRTLLAQVDAQAQRVALGLGQVDDTADAAKTFTQSQITGLTAALAAKLPSAAVTAFILTLLDDATQADAQATLGVRPGVDVAAFNDSRLGISGFGGLIVEGHSYTQQGGNSFGSQFVNWTRRVAAALGVPNDETYYWGQSGGLAISPYDSSPAVFEGHGIGGLFRHHYPNRFYNIASNQPDAASATAWPALFVAMWGYNDAGICNPLTALGFYGYPTAQVRAAYRDALRTALSKVRAARLYPESDTSRLTFTGTWSTVTATYALKGRYRTTTTSGDSVTWTLPADFPGGWVSLCFLGGPNAYGQLVQAVNGSQAVIGLTRVVSGSSDVRVNRFALSSLPFTIRVDSEDMVVTAINGNGSAARQVTDAVTNGTTTLTSATGAFTSNDVGKMVVCPNVAAGTTIASVTNSTTVVLSAAASGSGSGLTAQFVPGFAVTRAAPATHSASADVTRSPATYAQLSGTAGLTGTVQLGARGTYGYPLQIIHRVQLPASAAGSTIIATLNAPVSGQGMDFIGAWIEDSSPPQALLVNQPPVLSGPVGWDQRTTLEAFNADLATVAGEFSRVAVADLETPFKARFGGTVVSTFNSAATSLQITPFSAADFELAIGSVLRVDTEDILVTGISGLGTSTVTVTTVASPNGRGWNGTTAASHTAGVTIANRRWLNSDQVHPSDWGHEQIARYVLAAIDAINQTPEDRAAVSSYVNRRQPRLTIADRWYFAARQGRATFGGANQTRGTEHCHAVPIPQATTVIGFALAVSTAPGANRSYMASLRLDGRGLPSFVLGSGTITVDTSTGIKYVLVPGIPVKPGWYWAGVMPITNTSGFATFVSSTDPSPGYPLQFDTGDYATGAWMTGWVGSNGADPSAFTDAVSWSPWVNTSGIPAVGLLLASPSTDV